MQFVDGMALTAPFVDSMAHSVPFEVEDVPFEYGPEVLLALFVKKVALVNLFQSGVAPSVAVDKPVLLDEAGCVAQFGSLVVPFEDETPSAVPTENWELSAAPFVNWT